MGYLERLFAGLDVTMAIPIVALLAIAGGACWLLRRDSRLAAADDSTPELDAPAVSLAGALPATPKEQRTANRRTGNPIDIYLAEPNKKDHPDHACLLDRSVGGMRLAVYRELTVGTIISIRPASAAAIVPWIDLEVRSCRRADTPGEFELGCQFVKTPPYSILLLFG